MSYIRGFAGIQRAWKERADEAERKLRAVEEIVDRLDDTTRLPSYAAYELAVAELREALK